MLALSSSPRTTAATPSGVPVKIRSPGASVQAAERCSMISGMLQISLPIWLCWRVLPLTSRRISVAASIVQSAAGLSAPIGAGS